MKIISSLFLSGLLLIGNFNSHSSQEAPELKEAATLTQSVVKLLNERKFDAALPNAKRALEIRERSLTPGDPQISTSLQYLADIYIGKRDYGAALKVLQRLLQNQEQRIGPNHVGLAATLDRVAALYRREGDSRKAEDTYKRAIALREKTFGPDSVEVARSLSGLAEVYRDLKDFDRAAPIYKRALLIYGQQLGIKSVEFERTGVGYTCLGHETQTLDKIDLRAIRERFTPPENPQASDSLAEPPSSRILNGRALSLPKPEYPQQASLYGLGGTIVVSVVIDETGRVIEARDTCQGPAVLSEAAVNAARLARFSPTKLSGMPVKVNGVIVYNFVRQ